jgi:hypothetical protein
VNKHVVFCGFNETAQLSPRHMKPHEKFTVKFIYTELYCFPIVTWISLTDNCYFPLSVALFALNLCSVHVIDHHYRNQLQGFKVSWPFPLFGLNELILPSAWLPISVTSSCRLIERSRGIGVVGILKICSE